MRLVVAAALYALASCAPPSGVDAGSAPVEDAGDVAEDAGAPPPDEDAGPTGGAQGAPCSDHDDCASGFCRTFLDPGEGYCSILDCAADDDCAVDGEEWRCLDVGGSFMCNRTCDMLGCPDEVACIWNTTFGDDVASFCYDASESLCGSDADCEAGTYCSPLRTGGAIYPICRALNGYLRGGDACEPNLPLGDPCVVESDCGPEALCDEDTATCFALPGSLCATGGCLVEGVCPALCAEDDDCGAGSRCESSDARITKTTATERDDDFAELGLCRPFAGSMAACTSDDDCTAAAERCTSFTPVGAPTSLVCRASPAGAAAYGAACVDDARTPLVDEGFTPCAGGACLATPAGAECAQHCGEQADCDAAGARCLPIVFDKFGDAVGTCVVGAPCTGDAACGPDEACVALSTADGFDLRCAPARGRLAPGEPCDPQVALDDDRRCLADADCPSPDAGWSCNLGSRRCEAPAATCDRGSFACTGDRRCDSFCAGDADCADAGPGSCSGYRSTLDDQDTGTVTDDVFDVLALCVVFPGTRAPCARDADCTTAGEVCAPSTNLAGDPTTVCRVALVGGGASGAPCPSVDGELAACANDFCVGGRCSAMCVDDADCATGMVCGDVRVADDPASIVSACVPEG